MRFAIRYTLIVMVSILIIGVGANLWVVSHGCEKLFFETDEIEHSPVGLVLGTSSSPDGVRINSYFEERMEAAIRLYEKGKVKHLLLSGDNSSIYYNEPRDMRNYLISRGIPAEDITLDYAGFRTYDSMLRAKEIFGLDDFLIITQKFHGSRALFIAKQNGINARVYVAGDPQDGISSKLVLREWMARIVAVMDVITNRKPRFYGPPEFINTDV
jgi:SanA protein